MLASPPGRQYPAEHPPPWPYQQNWEGRAAGLQANALLTRILPDLFDQAIGEHPAQCLVDGGGAASRAVTQRWLSLRGTSQRVFEVAALADAYARREATTTGMSLRWLPPG
jgi:hypothetical protein